MERTFEAFPLSNHVSLNGGKAERRQLTVTQEMVYIIGKTPYNDLVTDGDAYYILHRGGISIY